MTRKIATFAALLGFLAGTGCVHSNVDEHFGDAMREGVARQTADPEASAANATEPAPQGADGVTAEAAMVRYRDAGKPGKGAGGPLPMIVTESSSLGSN